MRITEFILWIIFSIISTIIIVTEPDIRNNYYLVLIHILIIWIAVFMIFNDSKKYISANKISNLFFIFFFGIAPILQFKSDITFWSAPKMPDSAYIIASLVLLLTVFLYNVLYVKLYNFKIPIIILYNIRNYITKYSTVCYKITKKGEAFALILSLIIFFIILKDNNYNVVQLLFRGTIDELIGYEKERSLMASLIYTAILRPMPIFIFLFISFYSKNKLVIFLVFLITLVSIFPTSIPRLQVAALYGPIVMVWIPILRKRNIFVFSLSAALLIIFPFLDSFRGTLMNDNKGIEFNMEMFKVGHFDSYLSFVEVMYYDFVTYGYQLLGAIGFFIPRAIWSDKPYGSGQTIAHEFGFHFDNISCNFFAEGYVNFGLIGVFLFTIVYAHLTSLIDKIMYSNYETNSKSFVLVVYLMICFMLFFILRGDLMAGTTFVLGMTISSLSVFYMLKRFLKKTKYEK